MKRIILILTLLIVSTIGYSQTTNSTDNYSYQMYSIPHTIITNSGVYTYYTYDTRIINLNETEEQRKKRVKRNIIGVSLAIIIPILLMKTTSNNSVIPFQ